MRGSEDKTGIWIWILLAIAPLLIYWLSIGPFFRWEQSSRTQKQYLARNPRDGAVFSLKLPFYSLTFWFLLACAFFFYGAGEFGREKSSGLAWAALSLLISAAIWGWLHGGVIAVALGQVGLFAAITLYRSRRKA